MERKVPIHTKGDTDCTAAETDYHIHLTPTETGVLVSGVSRLRSSYDPQPFTGFWHRHKEFVIPTVLHSTFTFLNKRPQAERLVDALDEMTDFMLRESKQSIEQVTEKRHAEEAIHEVLTTPPYRPT